MHFKKNSKYHQAGISTASLPDIVFMLLFFFMVTTVMVEHTPEVDAKIPDMEALTELKNRSLIEYIYVGPHKNYPADDFKIQHEDNIIRIEDLAARIDSAIQARPESDKPKVTVSLTIHQDTEMQLVDKIKTQLQEARAYKVLYETAPIVTASN